ncbi:MAG: alpha/beta hydrolase [Planctomycetota bacterium]|nr:alpha/beta hydrolase [Planctomycetota bacterium]
MKTAILFVFLALPVAAQDLRGIEVLRDLEYGKGEGTSLKLDLYQPEVSTMQPKPVILYIHGGGWRGGDKRKAAMAADLVRRGFILVSINYRLSGVAKYPAAIDDCRTALKWIREKAQKYQIDPSRIGVLGPSAGGHLSLLLSLSLEGEDRVQAVCSWFGPADFTSGYEKKSNSAAWVFLGGSPSELPEVFKEASPATYVSKDDPPVFLIHGDKDTTVDIEQSEILYKKLKEAGVKVDFLRVKNAGHGFRPTGGRPSHSKAEIQKKTFAFFERVLLE